MPWEIKSGIYGFILGWLKCQLTLDALKQEGHSSNNTYVSTCWILWFRICPTLPGTDIGILWVCPMCLGSLVCFSTWWKLDIRSNPYAGLQFNWKAHLTMQVELQNCGFSETDVQMDSMLWSLKSLTTHHRITYILYMQLFPFILLIYL